MIFHVKEASVVYGNWPALKGFSLEFRSGEIVGLFGPNGAGKSTVLKMVMGLAPATGGSVNLDATEVLSQPAWRRPFAGIAYVPPNDRGFPELTVRENLRVAGTAIGSSSARREQIDWVADRMASLRGLLETKMGTLSGGQRSVATLGMALMVPEVKALLLDEALAGLSPSHEELVLDLIRGLASDPSLGLGVLMVEQRVASAMKIVDRAVFMRNGEIEAVYAEPSAIDENDLWRHF